MFEHLKEKQIILVTGPQRSGTRLIAKAIAYDTGHMYVDESVIRTDSVYELFWTITQVDRPIVVQCPGLCHIAPALVAARDQVFLIMCIREIDDILASQERINWEWEWLERLKYANQPFLLYLCRDDPVAKVKYDAWKHDKQSLYTSQYCEVYYEDMKDHSLWVAKKHRKEWGFSQTKIEEKPCS